MKKFFAAISLDKIFLKVVSVFYPLLHRTGIDTTQLNEILKIKLLIDERRPKTMFAVNRNAQNNKKQSNWGTNFGMLMMGLIMGLLLFFSEKPYVAQTCYFFMFMVFMALTLISDFSNVLIDTREQFILLPRPVSDRTLALARILHISIYILRLTLLLGLPALILIGFINGLLAIPVFLVQILAATFLSVFFINIIYLILMDTVNPQRFKDVISYFQIAFSVLIFGAYYLLPRLVNISVISNMNLLSHKWAYFLPPVWVAALNEVTVHSVRANFVSAILALFGLVLPVIGLWLVAKILAPGFNRRLSIISTSDDSNTSPLTKNNRPKFNIAGKLGNFLAPDPNENAGFLITWKLSTRLREFKLRVWPAFAYVPMYFVYFAFNTKGDGIKQKWEQLQSGHSYILLIYLCTFILSSILTNISMSEKYKSAWVYYALPVQNPGRILSGMYKAIITIYFLPYCLLLSCIIIAIWGPQAINDIILAFLVSVAYGLLLALFMVKGLPFSNPLVVQQGGGKIIKSLLILSFIGIIGTGHYLFMRYETAVWITIIPLLLINWLMFRYYKQQTWQNLEFPDI